MRKGLAITIFSLAGMLCVSPFSYANTQAALSEAEQSYHEQVFSYAMDNTLAGRFYDWKTYSGRGRLTVEAPFISKSGANCRNYTETFEIQGVKGEIKGVGCKRAGKAGWCNLKPSNALTCALEKPHYLAGRRHVTFSPNPAAADAGGGGGGGSGVDVNVGGSVNAPNVNTNVNVKSPNMPKPGKAGEPSAQGVAYDVTNTLGNAGVAGTATALSWWDALFR